MQKTQYLLILVFSIFTSNFSFSQCSPPTAGQELDINNVRAGLLNGGDFWWDGVGLPRYEYPKNSGRTGLFAGGIWLSALDSAGTMLTSAMKYRSDGFDFYPGPINTTTGTVSNASCTAFDRFWEVTKNEIQFHLDNVTLSLPVALSQINDAILYWPAKGNVHFTNYAIQDDLAPFVDFNSNGIYDPENGDYPDIKGDQAIFWVVNDIGGLHTNTTGVPIGVEVQFLAYSYASPLSMLDNSTFYDIKVIKKTSGDASDFYMGLFVDPDLGNALDDFVGCDTLTNSGFVYNGDAFDDDFSGRPGYGLNIPIISTTFLNQTMSSFSYFNNSAGAFGDPVTPTDYRNFLKGLWKDGSVRTVGGYGVGGTIPTKYIYFDNPVAPLPAWSEASNSNTPGDRRYIQSSGPYSLDYLTAIELSFVAIAHPVIGSTDISVSVLPTISQLTQLYTDSLKNGNVYDFSTGIASLNEDLIKLYPNPVTSILTIDLNGLTAENIRIYDMNGREIYQFDGRHNGETLKIDMSVFENGFYLMSLEVDKERHFYKILNTQY